MAIVFSYDAERNGLHGNTTAIAVIVMRDNQEIDRFVGRLPDDAFTGEWCLKHVLPACRPIEVSHTTSVDLEEAFWEFWIKYREEKDLEVVANVGWPVEDRLFLDCIDRNHAEREWQGPYPRHELATAFALYGETPESCYEFLLKHEEELDEDIAALGEHHPLFDCYIAAECWDFLKHAVRC